MTVITLERPVSLVAIAPPINSGDQTAIIINAAWQVVLKPGDKIRIEDGRPSDE